MEIRSYKPSDLPVIVNLFHDTVHKVNIRDYTREQIDVWASGTVDMQAWDKSLKEHQTLVALINGNIVGFGDIDNTGYLDRLYVHHLFQDKGIATALCDKLEKSADAERIVAHVSITARPFFESRGYKVIKEQTIERNGICLKNYIMKLSRRKK
ncbi:MAG: GNAT family N-acetyltransferase [Roseburia sp.]|nr:GNAT family N-acetyltransferase [Roseburia sp.]